MWDIEAGKPRDRTPQIPRISRRGFLAAAGAAVGAAGFLPAGALARDVDWLESVQQPPADFPARPLPPLLVDDAGRPISTLDGWRPARENLRRRWLEFLGPMPAARPPVKLEVVREETTDDGVSRQLVRYESEPGIPVEAYLLRPAREAAGRDARGRRPALVGLHQTTNDTIEQIAGVKGPDAQRIGYKLAKQGFIVICPRNFLWQNGNNYRQETEAFVRRMPQTRGMHKMLWDSQQAVDVLCSLADEVDVNRIGAVGHSLGAKEALYLAAFDDRVVAAAASEGGIGFPFTNWHDPWYLGDAIKAADFPLEHHQLLALIAPRPFLILAGEQGPGAADGDRTWPYVAAALPVYRLYGAPARLGLCNHRQGHTVSDATFDKMAEWLRVYLEV